MTKTSHHKVSAFKLLLPLYALLIIVFAMLIHNGTMQVLMPSGTIADFQSKIFWGAFTFALVVGCTIIGSFFYVIFHYQEGKGRRYEPSWATGKGLQLLAWGVPSIVIVAISFAVWGTAHAIDPFKPLASTKQPVTIQVIALQWKWLFIYPNDRVATVNYLEIPVDTPVNLELTADAPMSSFWVPSLSGQIYAMTGMVTQLHIQADKAGNYPGVDAEINGDGYSGMDFIVKAVPERTYKAWKDVSSRAPQKLDYRAYTQLAQPSSYNAVATYAAPDPSLFTEVVMQFMAPGAGTSALHVRGTNL